MRLLYCYAEFLDQNGIEMDYHGFTHCELNFATDAIYHYDATENRLIRKEAVRPLPNNFWGKGIYNISTLSGRNGSGKTTILNWLLGKFKQLYENDNVPYKSDLCILLFEDILDNKPQHIIVKMPGLSSNNMPVKCDDPFTQSLLFPFAQDSSDFLQKIRMIKLMYLTNTLCEKDYQRKKTIDSNRYDFPYDRSLGGILYEYTHSSRHDPFEQYFTDEQYNQIIFLFDKRQRKILNELNREIKDIPIPQKLYIKIEKYPKNIRFFPPEQIAKLSQMYDAIKKGASGQPWRENLWSFCCLSAISFYSNITESPITVEDHSHDYSIIDSNLLEIASKPGNYDRLIKELSIIKKDNNKGKRFNALSADEIEQRYCNLIRFIQSEENHLFAYFHPHSIGFYVNIPDILADSKLTESMMEFLRLYRGTCVPFYPLSFKHGLSSGEDNLLRLFSSFYHVFDHNYDNKDSHPCRLYNGYNRSILYPPCNSVLILLDEADLTFHPEWQRKLINILTAFLPRIYPEDCAQDIQLILTTHSPLLIGDMPPGNVIYLPQNTNLIESFGENIHTLFRNSFYLDNTLGEFATKKINKTAMQLVELSNGKAALTADEKKQLDVCRKIVRLVAPGPIRAKLEQLLYEAEKRLGNQMAFDTILQKAEALSETERHALIEHLQKQDK